VNTRDDRDQSIDDLLRQSLHGRGDVAAPGSSCLDAETLGAWADGGLSENALAMVDAHLSECARCQRVVGVLAKLPASAPLARRSWWWQWGVDLRWVVPLAAGATAVALWVAVPGREAPQSVVSPQAPLGQSTLGPQPATAPSEGRIQARADRSALKSETAEAAPSEQRDAGREADSPVAIGDSFAPVTERATAVQPAAQPAAPPAAPTAAAAVEALAGARPEAFALSRQSNVITQEVVSPTSLIRWRVGPRGLLQYSASGGAAWEQLSTSVTADLTAGASPSSTVCWVVGRAGTVLLTVDGRRFSTLPFPTAVDLTAVRATDARAAVVTTADGRQFSTTDGGSTWTQ